MSNKKKRLEDFCIFAHLRRVPGNSCSLEGFHLKGKSRVNPSPAKGVAPLVFVTLPNTLAASPKAAIEGATLDSRAAAPAREPMVARRLYI